MTEEKTAYLRAKYPRAFETLRWGTFECGDGWAGLIEEFGAFAESRGLSAGVIKEKWGVLCIQGVQASDEGAVTKDCWPLLVDLETRSASVCETCGAPGRRVTRGMWWMTRCEVCQPYGRAKLAT